MWTHVKMLAVVTDKEIYPFTVYLWFTVTCSSVQIQTLKLQIDYVTRNDATFKYMNRVFNHDGFIPDIVLCV